MNFAALFIRRPITTTLIMLGITVFGVMSYQLLPVADLPTVDFPNVQVQAGLPGASPETMASAVALPLEKQFATIAGLQAVNSTSTQGNTNITLQFDLDRNIDAAAADVQAMIARAARQLPQMPNPPSYNKVNPGDQPVIFLALRSATLPLSTVNEYAETIGQRISMVNGVAQVQLFGAAKYAVRVDLDPRRLSARGIGIDEVATAIQSANVNLPTGTMYGPARAFTVLANGQLMRAPNYGPLVVAYRNGNPVRLNEIAKVYDGIEQDKQANFYRGLRNITLSILKQPGTNVVAVVDSIKELMPAFRETLPPGVLLDVRTDRSASIRESVHDVKMTLYLTFVLVVTVIFVFLRSMTATIIASLTLPVTMAATLAIMYLLNYSLDNLSLMALTLSVGFVVDNTIVMLENVVRHLEMGKSPMQASYDGSKEVAFTIVAMTASLVAIFIPVLFMGGLVGRLLEEFAVTIGAAIVVSGFISISLTPMLCSRFLRHHTRHGALYNVTERMFQAWVNAYDWSLRLALRHRFITAVASLTLIAGSAYLFLIVPKGFLPSEDQDRFNISVEGLQGIGFDEMMRKQMAVADIVAKDPDIIGFSNNVGGGGGGGGGQLNTGRMGIDLKPKSERTRSVDQIIADLRPQVAKVPGVRVFMVNQPPINLGGQQGARSIYQFTLQDTDTEVLYRSAPLLEAKMREIPGVEDVNSDLRLNNPTIQVDIDRDRVSSLGLTVNQVETALYNAYGTRQISQIYAANNQYAVIMGVAPEFQSDPAALSMLYVRSSSGKLIPLNTVAKVTTGAGPLSVSHTGQLPSVTISFNLKPGIALGDAVAQIQSLATATLPATVSTRFQGTAQAFQDSLRGLGVILIMAIVVIYLVLGILYESFTQPLVILSGLPAAGFGALLTLLIFKSDLSLYAFVGVIMLVGLVKKNGIMMVDFAAVAEREHGKTPLEAIHEACLVRFRPIMMTTMCALVGTLPIALGAGAGAESRRPLGLAVVGGLLVSQLLTLYITPVYYVYIENARLRLTRRRQEEEAPSAPPLESLISK
ncbi:MAG: efflux RND transporter permease subunit [Cyanobacteria bacterium]|nr:efflux RND transporter permease subunit [Cyanobacteriota bacterium]